MDALLSKITPSMLVFIIIVLTIVFMVTLLALTTMIGKLSIKTKNLEVSSVQVSSSQYKLEGKLEQVEQNKADTYRLLVSREVGFVCSSLQTYEELIYQFVIKANKDDFSDIKTANALRLLINYMMSNLCSRVSVYVAENHLGSTDEEYRNYAEVRGTEIYNLIRVFLQTHIHLVKEGYPIEAIGRGLPKPPREYIIEELYKVIRDCKKLSITVR